MNFHGTFNGITCINGKVVVNITIFDMLEKLTKRPPFACVWWFWMIGYLLAKEVDNLFSINQLLPTSIKLFTLNESFDDYTCSIMGAFSMATLEKRPHHFAPIGHTKVFAHKIPRICTLNYATHPSNHTKVSFQCILLFHHVLPMKLEAMLHKFWVMLAIVRNIKMILSKGPCLLIIGIILRVMTKTNEYQYANLVRVPMVHTLYLIMDLKGIIIGKVHNWHNTLIWKSFQASLELFVFPTHHKVMFHKMLELWFQIIYHFI